MAKESMPVWAESTFSATALGSEGLAGETIQLDVGFGTDDGERVTIEVDGSPIVKRIRGDKARWTVTGAASGNHTI